MKARILKSGLGAILGAALVLASDEHGDPLLRMLDQLVIPVLVLPLMLMGYMRALADAVAFAGAAAVAAGLMAFARPDSDLVLFLGAIFSAFAFALMISPVLLLLRASADASPARKLDRERRNFSRSGLGIFAPRPAKSPEKAEGEVHVTPEEVLEFWLGDAAQDPARELKRRSFWFEPNPDVDARIAERFSTAVRRAARGELAAWEGQARTCLALVILLDQFTRNLERGKPEAFECDAQALEIVSRGVAAGYLERLSTVEQCMFLLPYEHSEDAAVHREGIALLERIADEAPPDWAPCARISLEFARRHQEIVEKFGRYPHRNAALGRTSTAAERAYLEGGGESFGQ